MPWTNFNPSTGLPLATYTYATMEDLDQVLGQLEKQFQKLKTTTMGQRSEALLRLARLLRKQKNNLAFTMAQEMGKPVSQGRLEVEKCAVTCEFYALNGERFMMSQEIQGNYGQTWLVKRPLGIILAVMPWNFPLWQVFRCSIPAWVAGNTILLKHAPTVQGCALQIEELVKQAFADLGLEPLKQLPLTFEGTEMALKDRRIRGLSFTGSTQTGRHLASIAGRALKKSVLELGGSDPYIVLADADVELAARLCVKARLINAGQSCVAAKRFLIHQSIFSEFKQRSKELIEKLVLGDPLLETTEVGPLAEKRLWENLQRQYHGSLDQGARLVTRTELPENLKTTEGYYFSPILIENINPQMDIFSEESFGPIMPLMEVSSLEEALQVANQSSFGLGAAIFTKKPEQVWPEVVDHLEAGMIAFNEMVQSDPRVPFGGVKDSGWGRELGSQGIMEFVNLKTMGLAKGFF